jgi:DNA recombination protein RmuC
VHSSIADLNDVLVAAAAFLLGLLLSALALQARARRERIGLEALARSAQVEAAAQQARLDAALREAARREADVARHETRAEELRQALAGARAELAEAGARHAAESRAAEEKLALLAEAREKLGLEFGAIANRIFQEKTDRFSQDSKTALDLTLSPLREQLADFRRRVDEVHTGDTEGRARLLQEIGALKDLNRRMSEEAVNLTRALKGDSKVQGNWGEVILERILEDSGLHKGREYETQVASVDAHGQRRMPDVIVRLPEGRDVVIDAKVSLTDYERFCSAETEAGREAALRAHVASLQAHIAALGVKDYAALEGIRTLDFVLVFVPIEAAFMKAMEQDPTLFGRAFERNIIMVSPTTLLATLRTIESMWRLERQNRNAEEIARRAGALHDQFARVLESLEDLGRHLERTRAAYDLTLERFARGRGNLVSRVTQLEKLGARARKALPDAILAVAELDEEEPLPDDADG